MIEAKPTFKIPDAKTYAFFNIIKGHEQMLKDFAIMHVQAALLAASKNYAQGSLTPGKGVSIKDAILSAYPLNNIK
jgi:hypothetical protein